MNPFDTIFFSKYVHDSDELLFVCHRHIVMIVDDILVYLFFGLLLPGFVYYLDMFSVQSIIPFLYFEGYIVALYLFLIYRIFDWYNDVWLITDKGVIDIDWNIFARNVSYIEFAEMKEIEIHTGSFLDSLIDKADLIIHVGGEWSEFILQGAGNPHEVVELIDESIKEHEHHHEEEEEEHKEPFEVLLETLSEIVKDHLEGKSSKEPEVASEEEVEEVLQKKGTVDLR